MNRALGSGHLEHWQVQEAAEAARRQRRLSQAESNLDGKDEQIRQLTSQVAVMAASLQLKDLEISRLNQSLGASSATIAAICELRNACRYDELRAEIERLAANYAQIKAVVTPRKIH